MGASGIWNHAAAASISMASARSMDGTTSGTAGGTSSSDSATISANDFLTLLVTEMQNQDPTANTDPNEYINQLVQVNSLEQLIDINQTLTTDSTPTATGGALPGAPAKANASHAASSATQGTTGRSAVPVTGARTTRSVLAQAAAAFQSQAAPTTSGNLGIPAATSASRRVAQSLNGQARNE